MSRVEDPAGYPWSVNTKLILYFPVGIYVGSGVLIDGSFLLTVGHNVYDPDLGVWADSVKAIPAYSAGFEPYGSARSVNLFTWDGWRLHKNYDDDMAFVQLDRPVGALANWHSYGYNDDDSFFIDSVFISAGYPAASPYTGAFMYYWFGSYDNVLPHILYFPDRGVQGLSGSGSYTVEESTRTVYAVHSHALLDASTGFEWWVGHTRINAAKYSALSSVIAARTPPEGDLVPLNVSVEPPLLNAGEQLSSVEFVVYNNSSAPWTGTFPVRMYLRDDGEMATDVLLQTATLTHSFDAKQAVKFNVTHPPSVPASTVAGDYRVVVELDVADFDVNNNLADGDDAAFILVLPSAQLTISGSVRSTSGAGISDVELRGLPGNPLTDVNGYYSVSVEGGWSGVVTPIHSCYTFSPPSMSYSDLTESSSIEDYTGTLKHPVISGYVTDNSGSGIAGVMIDGLPGNPTSNTSGHYSVTVDCGWSGTATPSKECYSFSPPNQSFTDITADVTADVSALPDTFTISGTIRNRSGLGVGGVALLGFSEPVTSNADGSYQGVVECEWSGTITPVILNGVFDPPQRSYSSVESDVANANHTVNRPPQIPTFAAAVIAEGFTLSIEIHAPDPDGDSVSITASDLPANAVFVDHSDGTGFFQFTPDYSQSGVYEVTIDATDGELTGQKDLEIYVENTNRPPSPFTLISPWLEQVVRDSTVELVWHSTTDPDPNEDVFYAVFLRETGSDSTPTARGTDQDTVLVASNLKEDTPYSWRVFAVDTSGGQTINSGDWQHFSIDDFTPPEFIFGMIPSPVLPFSVDLVVKPSEPLQGFIEAMIDQVNSSDAVELDHRVQSSDGDLFSGKYAFRDDGSGIITLHGVDESTNESYDTIPFSSYRADPGASLVGMSHDHLLRIHQERGSDAEAALLVGYRDEDTPEFDRFGWTPLGTPYRFRTSDFYVDAPYELRIRPETAKVDGHPANVIAFQLMSGEWVPIETWYSERYDDYVAYPTELGVFMAAVGPDNDGLQTVVLPRSHRLHQNVPNPFNPSTTIKVSVAESADIDLPDVNLTVYNVLGQMVKSLARGPLRPGLHSFVWDGISGSGQPLPSGIYFARLQVGNSSNTIKMVMIK